MFNLWCSVLIDCGLGIHLRNVNPENAVKKCTAEATVNCYDCMTWCVFCKNNNHQSVDKKCTEFSKQKKIKEAMTYLNVSFKEAELVVDNPASRP